MATVNNENNFDSIDQDIGTKISDIYGKPCCRQRVGGHKSLSLGFGEKVFHEKKRTLDKFYGEWELGTYRAAWRIMRNGHILCGSRDLVDSVNELDDLVNAISLGKIIAPIKCFRSNISISFDCGAVIDFFSVSSDDDEVFHMFGPDNVCVSYTPSIGWEIGKSNIPG